MELTEYQKNNPLFKKLLAFIKSNPDKIYKPYNRSKPGISISGNGVIIIDYGDKLFALAKDFMKDNNIAEDDLQ